MTLDQDSLEPGPVGSDKAFDKLAHLAFSLFYDESRLVLERFVDSICGGLIYGIRETENQERARQLLSSVASENPDFAYEVGATVRLVSVLLGAAQFQKLLKPENDPELVIEALSQVLFNLFRDTYEEQERSETMKELTYEALCNGLVFGLVLWREQPELAGRLAGRG